MTPATIRVAFDSGWTDGDPGNGRVRFNSPRLTQARFLYINARDAQDAILDELVPTWALGDVVVVERPGAERNRVVAWIIGGVFHGGSYWKVPIAVRTVSGSFAAHDELVISHHRNVTEIDEDASRPADIVPLPRVGKQPPPLPAPVPQQALPAPTVPPPLPIVAPPASEDLSPELARIAAENEALHELLGRLMADQTELYVVEGTK